MNEHDIRLECLKLGHRADREATEIVQRAEAFEKYIMGAPEKVVEQTPPEAKRKSGTLSSRG